MGLGFLIGQYLSYDSVCVIREEYGMNIVKKDGVEI